MFVTKHGITTKFNKTAKMEDLLMFNAKAEEPEQKEPKQETQSTVNFEDLITKARAEEKAKLYPKIQKLEGEKETLVQKNNQLLLDLGTKDSRISELEGELEKVKSSNKNNESEAVKSLKEEINQLQATIQELESNTVDLEEVRNQIKEEYDTKLYREQRLREVGDTVIPELVMGTTKEEIDASITQAQNRFQEILAKHGGTVQQTQVTPNNVNTSSLNVKDLSVDDISRMTPEEWAEKRKMLGFK